MRGGRLISFVGAVALAGVTATTAHAETRKAPLNVTVRNEAPIAPQGANTLKWDAEKGRWGLTLNMERPQTRAMQLNDVQAGAYFKITPSLRVGGAVALSDRSAAAQNYGNVQAADRQPRVRLETAFKF